MIEIDPEEAWRAFRKARIPHYPTVAAQLGISAQQLHEIAKVDDWEGRQAEERQALAEAAQARHARQARSLSLALVGPVTREVRRRIEANTWLADLTDDELLTHLTRTTTALKAIAEVERKAYGLDDVKLQIGAGSKSLGQTLREIWEGD